jgi:hypothetical protein
VFRLIVLMQFEDGTDPEPLIAALAAMPTQVPSIRRSEVTGDLGLTRPYGLHADLAWIADFDDQAAWEAYGASAPHAEFHALCGGRVKKMLVNTWSHDG